MERKINSEFLNKLEIEIRNKIAFAIENALSEDKYKKILEEEFKMRDIEKKRELSDQEVEQFFPFRDQLNKATVFVETITEARRVMEILKFNTHSLLDTIAHENAHGNRAEQLGAKHLGYNFLIIKRNNGGLGVIPQASLYIPDEWDKETQQAVLSEITWAPDDYGNEISESDKRDLKHLHNKE